MKKVLSIVAALAICAGAFAQAPEKDKQIFNHMAAGVTFGLDGIGLEVAAPFTPYVQLRAGYSFFVPPTIKVSNLSKFGVPESIKVEEQQRPLGSVATAAVGLNLGGGKALADIFVIPDGGFHFTVGAYFGNPLMVQADLDLSKVLQADEYASYGFQLDENDPNTNITTDKQGHLNLDLKTWNVRPYVGIGVGRPVNTEKRVSVTFDMGAIIWGAQGLQTYDYSLKNVKTVELSSQLMAKNSLTKGFSKYVGILEEIPIFPMLKLNVFVRLF
ncbi:MAG: hypothetical protein K6G39_06195 [Bacteroidales bacterium]|nr:hypothetical protein [Bacteroidales bacterium]